MAGASALKLVQSVPTFGSSPTIHNKQFVDSFSLTFVFFDTCLFPYHTCKLKANRVKNLHCPAVGSAAHTSVICAPLQRIAPTFYEVLGVSQGVSDVEIKKAYRNMVKLYHPDHAPPEKAEEYQKKFMEIRRAYSILKDPRRRVIYDFEIKKSRFSRSWRYEEKTGHWRGRNWETDQCWTS